MRTDVEYAERLESIFGYWPSFHDAEVWSLTQERTKDGFDVTATIHTFEMTSEVDSRGFYRLQKHTRVTLRFADCHEASFRWFNGQNVLSSLDIGAADAESVRSIHVIFSSSYGLEGELMCRKVQVIEAVPWQPPFGVHAPQAD